MADDEKEMGAAYVPWGTFKRSLEDLLQGLPNQIDRSVWKGQSWGTQSQLISAFKFLGLIDDKGIPGDYLVTLAEMEDEASRKVILDAIFRDRYSDLFDLDLTKATSEQVERAMGNYRVSGETREKAVRFFLSGLQYLGIPVSKHLQPKASNGGGNARGKRRPKPKAKAEVPPPLPPPPSHAGTSKIVNLRSGGTLTVSATLDLFSLSPTDRAFVFDLIDKLEGYERLSTQPDKEEEET